MANVHKTLSTVRSAVDRLEVGMVAPDFALASQSGELVRLLGSKREHTVLYFYPRDSSRGCTMEAHSFETRYRHFSALDAQIIGISSDSLDSHRRFAAACKLSFPILSDTGGRVRRLYGVPSVLGLIPKRVTFIVNSAGIIEFVFSSRLNPGRHAERALFFLETLGRPTARNGPPPFYPDLPTLFLRPTLK